MPDKKNIAELFLQTGGFYWYTRLVLRSSFATPTLAPLQGPGILQVGAPSQAAYTAYAEYAA